MLKWTYALSAENEFLASTATARETNSIPLLDTLINFMLALVREARCTLFVLKSLLQSQEYTRHTVTLLHSHPVTQSNSHSFHKSTHISRGAWANKIVGIYLFVSGVNQNSHYSF